jgi:hypothetical protein
MQRSYLGLRRRQSHSAPSSPGACRIENRDLFQAIHG